MPKTNFAPWSAETAQGIKTDPVNSNITVRQEVVPAITVGTVNALTGEWTGVQESDTDFLIDPTHEAVGNGAAVLSPQLAKHDYIDMTGFSSIFIALNVSNAGNYSLDAVMGPDSNNYANLSPVNASARLKGAVTTGGTQDLFIDGAEGMTADVWNIFAIYNTLSNWKLLQFKITNNSGGPSNIKFATLRVV